MNVIPNVLNQKSLIINQISMNRYQVFNKRNRIKMMNNSKVI
jgi:hypothetical protein